VSGLSVVGRDRFGVFPLRGKVCFTHFPHFLSADNSTRVVYCCFAAVVFALVSKLLNVREAAHKQIMENAEIVAIKKILGLQQGKEYTDTKTLRYGHLMIMTDQVFSFLFSLSRPGI